MGAYLSTPRTEKDSSDEKTDEMLCGASSMQGWRINQEDAHNCVLNFDKDSSFFAVYDGHGGPEIALYCSEHLPAFLKSTEAYARGDFEQALKDAFLGFDSKLLGPDVIEQLKVLAGDKYGYGEEDGEEDSDEDLAELKQEGGMPIEAVLTKYRDMMKNHPVARLKDEEPGGSAGSSSSGFKPHSPCLRGKKQALTGGTENGASSSEKPSGSTGDEDEAVSSSSAKVEEGVAAAAASTTDGEEAEKPTVSKPMESPDSSSTDKVGNSDTASAGGSSSASSKGNDVSSSSSNSVTEVVEAGGSSGSSAPTAAAGGSSSVNGGDSTGSISSTNVERAAKRVALALSQPTASTPADSDDSEEDEKDMTYDENCSTDDDDEDEENDDGEGDEDDEDDDEEEEEEEEDGEEDDGFISNMVEEPGKDSGCTAVVAFKHGRNLYVANAGDSRCVLSRSGEVIEMSFDHKPEDTEEYQRITKAGGRVTLDGRVNGGLNLSRAIGDHAYKMSSQLPAAEQMISALPDVKKIELTDADDFMVLACDGIWNFMSSEAVVKFVKARLDKGETKLSKVCEELFDHCLAKDTSGDGTGCDNMTAIIVRFKWPSKDVAESEAAPVLEVGLKRAASSSPLPVPEISEAEADGGIKAKRAKTEVEDAQAPTTTST